MRADLSGRVAVITGGAGGIGRALGRAFLDQGARVALLDLAGVDEVAAELGCVGVACDVTDPTACDRAMAEVVTRLGRIDVLVNNAGISHRSRFVDTDPAVLRKVMEVNFFGAANCTRSALDEVVRRRGWIVAVSSVAGFAPLIGRTGYAASKHALHGFFDTLRAELVGTGVSVLVACPAFTKTAIRTNALSGDGGQVSDAGGSVGRQLRPEDVAAGIVDAVRRRERRVFLGGLSRASWWITRLAPRAFEALMRRTQRAVG